MHWFQKCNSIKSTLSHFRGCWGQEVIFEVIEAKFWISFSFYMFSFRIFVILHFEVVWPWRTSASSEWAQWIFSKITFLKSVHSKEKDDACLSFLEEIFTKSVHRGGVGLHLFFLSNFLEATFIPDSIAAQTRKLKHEKILPWKKFDFMKIEIQLYKILGLILLE